MSQLFNSGTGRAFGGEAFLREPLARLGRVARLHFRRHRPHDPGLQLRPRYHPTYDRRHQVVVAQNHPLSERWQMSFTFHYGSGQPTDPAGRPLHLTGTSTGAKYDLVLEGEKNASGCPPITGSTSACREAIPAAAGR